MFLPVGKGVFPPPLLESITLGNIHCFTQKIHCSGYSSSQWAKKYRYFGVQMLYAYKVSYEHRHVLLAF